ncbi:HNH endonuclease [Sphingomonas corticis]|uniref:HNH endonuclease n=1 Tax=Sphingomonas corticis TaxID=2722791 RepID=UPI0030B85712
MKRRAGLAAAAVLAQREGAPSTCALCDRALGSRVEWHHVVPKSEGGTATVAVHPICHRAIHAAASNAALAKAGSIAAIRELPALARFRAFVAGKPPDFHAPTRRMRERD